MTLTAEIEEAIDFHVRNGQLRNPDSVRDSLTEAAKLKYYGRPFGALTKTAQGLVVDGHIDPHAMAGGLYIASSLAGRSNGRYARQEVRIEGDELLAHQDNVIAGRVVRVDKKYAMEYEASVMQVIDANAAFVGDTKRIGIQGAIGAANYSHFNDGTMTSAEELAAKLRANSPSSWEQVEYTKMTHLDASNANAAHTLVGILRYAKAHELRVRLFSVGSGTGASDAALINTVISAMDIEDLPEIALTCFEQTPHFYNDLCKYLEGPEGARLLGLDTVRAVAGDTNISNFGSVTIVYGDANLALNSMDKSQMGGPDEIDAVYKIYVEHRRPSDIKAEEAEMFSGFENIIFLTGDLEKNTSFVNREYFNLAINGWLNVGNLYLPITYAKAGYEVVDLSKEQPSAIPADLARHLVPNSINPDNDGHFCIAYKGVHAGESLGLVRPLDIEPTLHRVSDLVLS